MSHLDSPLVSNVIAQVGGSCLLRLVLIRDLSEIRGVRQRGTNERSQNEHFDHQEQSPALRAA